MKLLHLLLVLSVFSLSSCSSVQKMAQNVKVPKPTLKLKKPKLPQWKKPDFSKLAFLNPKNFSWKDLRKKNAKIPIVEVIDEKKLKKQKTGEQLYLAYNDKKKSYGYTNKSGSVFEAVDFNPDELPQGDSSPIPTYGLLPALDGSSGSSSGPASLPNFSFDDLPDVILPDEPDLGESLPDGPKEVKKPAGNKPEKSEVSPDASPAPAFLEFNPPTLD